MKRLGLAVSKDDWTKTFDFVETKKVCGINFIIVMISWTGLAPWEFEFPFPGSLTSTLLTQNGVEWHLSARRMIDHITAQHPHRTPKYA